MTFSLQDSPSQSDILVVSKRRKKAPANRFGRELHDLLAVIGLKRSAFGDRGYTYSLHKQICRGERPPSTRALASLERLLNHRLDHLVATQQHDPAKLDQLTQRLQRFDWLQAQGPARQWKVNPTALGQLWQPPEPVGAETGLPLLLEGKLTGLNLTLPAKAPLPRLRFRRQRFTLTSSKSGQMRLTVTLTRPEAERLRRLLTGS